MDRASPAKALVVEDKHEDLEAIAKTLKSVGLEVDLATDGVQAINLLLKNTYDLLMTDLLMPECSGFDVLEKVEELGLDLPIVVCSAYITPEGEKQLRRHGRIEIVRKPYKAETLIEAVRRSLGRGGIP